MIRRSFMSLLGLAPIATVTPIVQEQSYRTFIQGVNPIPSVYPEDPSDRIEYAREKLRALEYARENGIDHRYVDEYYENTTEEIRSFRSWSNVHKSQKISKVIAKKRAEHAIERAKFELEREMKMVLVPSWARKFI